MKPIKVSKKEARITTPPNTKEFVSERSIKPGITLEEQQRITEQRKRDREAYLELHRKQKLDELKRNLLVDFARSTLIYCINNPDEERWLECIKLNDKEIFLPEDIKWELNNGDGWTL